MTQVPYLFTVLLVLISWTVNQLSADLSKSPVMEISDSEYDATSESLVYTITNVSRNLMFKNFYFHLKLNEGVCTTDPEIQWLSPNMKLRETEAPSCENLKSASFPISQIHPSSKIKLILKTGIHVKSKLFIQSDSPIRLVESNLETFLVKHKTKILFGLFIVWATLLVVYIKAIKAKWLEIS